MLWSPRCLGHSRPRCSLADALASRRARAVGRARARDLAGQADETMWLTWGTRCCRRPRSAFSPLRLRFVFHPPLYLYFLGCRSRSPGSLVAVKYLQCLVGALLVRRRSGCSDRAASASGPGFSPRPGSPRSIPSSSGSPSHFWAETLFTVLLWWAIERLVGERRHAPRRRRPWPRACSSGLAILTRETVLYFLPLAALWLAWRRRGGPAARGAARLPRPCWSSCRGPCATTSCSTRSSPSRRPARSTSGRATRGCRAQEVYEEYWAVHGRIAQYQHARRRALEAILERQPLWIFEKLRSELPEFWEAHAQPIVHIERGAYGAVERPLALARRGVVLVPYLAVLVAVRDRASPPPARPGAAARARRSSLFYVLLHVAAHGYPRYRLPAMPALFLVAGHALSTWRAPRPAPDRARVAAAAAAALVLAIVGRAEPRRAGSASRGRRRGSKASAWSPGVRLRPRATKGRGDIEPVDAPSRSRCCSRWRCACRSGSRRSRRRSTATPRSSG